MLGLDLPVPDHTTFARRSARLPLTTALKKPKGPVTVVIDSSGLKVFGAGEWLHEKHGGKPRRSSRRLHPKPIPALKRLWRLDPQSRGSPVRPAIRERCQYDSSAVCDSRGAEPACS